jgi:hypothetical protein
MEAAFEDRFEEVHEGMVDHAIAVRGCGDQAAFGPRDGVGGERPRSPQSPAQFVGQAKQLPLATDRDTASRWGWLKLDELPKDVSAADYLDRIAALVEEWRTRPAGSPQALADEVLALRRGCDRLQLMSHPPLNPAQTADLLARCRKWAAQFDGELARLEKTRDVDGVRREVAETVNTLAAALRTEADRLRRQAGA